MLNAGFPNIENEASTIHFMINGIIDNPQYGLLATIMEQAPPTSIQDFANRLETHYQRHNYPPNASKTYPPQHHFASKHTSTGRQRPRQNKPPSYNGPWCNFHGTPTHGDNECRAQLKIRRYTPATLKHHQHDHMHSKSTVTIPSEEYALLQSLLPSQHQTNPL